MIVLAVLMALVLLGLFLFVDAQPVQRGYASSDEPIGELPQRPKQRPHQ